MKKCIQLTAILLLSLLFSANAIARCNFDGVVATTPETRFTMNDDGTVADSQTGLIWAQCQQGLSGSQCATGAATTHTWSQALALTTPTSAPAVLSGWRLPNNKELASIIEFACLAPSINPTVFPNTTFSVFWSSSPHTASFNQAWTVEFFSGQIGTHSRLGQQSVRLVRGRQ